jgi:signal transduction histidine kinase
MSHELRTPLNAILGFAQPVRASVRECATWIRWWARKETAAIGSRTRATATMAMDQWLTPYRAPTGTRAVATTYQSLALPGSRCSRW